MTFCMAMKTQEGLVGIADTQVTTGVERITARKISIFERKNHSMFVMTSGLRSVRDKAMTYFNEVIEEQDAGFHKLYHSVNAFAQQVRRVASEDKAALAESGLAFDLTCLIGGQLEKDKEHKLYLLYPEGNWTEAPQGTPYYMIGESAYGKPLLDRAFHYDTDMETALKIGILAFDATRKAATDVDYPIDVAWYLKSSFSIHSHRYERDDLAEMAKWWQQRIRKSIQELPSDWVADAMGPPRGKISKI